MMKTRWLIFIVSILLLVGCRDNEMCFDESNQVVRAKDSGFLKLYIENEESHTVFQITKRKGNKPNTELKLLDIDTSQYEIKRLGLQQYNADTLPLNPNSIWKLENVTAGSAASYEIEVQIQENGLIQAVGKSCPLD